MNPSITRCIHRSRDTEAARAFYAHVLGDTELELEPMSAAAEASGAPAHWIGAIGVEDVASTVAAFLARGAIALGPVRSAKHGDRAVLRDPGGAVIELCADTASLEGPTIAWTHLDARDAEANFAVYAELFGWSLRQSFELGAGQRITHFAWTGDGPSVGSLADLATRPEHHPQWLFHFQVPSLDDAANAVHAGGGIVLADTTLFTGRRVLVCDDPQMAGFALSDAKHGERPA